MKDTTSEGRSFCFSWERQEDDMGLVSVVSWMVAGLAIAIVTAAVTPIEQRPPTALTLVVGSVGGLLGGVVITLVANPTLTGLATGIAGSFMGSIISLLIWGLLAHAVQRES
jgi:uncharacterized membrane protein YeaQ/YmgE (transglycosylase-associated protein family)